MFKKINYKNAHFAWQVTWKYALFGVLWIGFSDRLLTLLIKDIGLYAKIQTYKGWLFIALTSFFLYMLVSKVIGDIQSKDAEINEKKRVYETYFNHANAGLIVMDLERKTLDVNDTFVEMIGMNMDDIRALDYKSAVHPDDYEVEMALFDKMKNGQLDRFKIHKHMTLNGKKMWLDEYVKAIKDEKGILLGSISAVVDVSDMKLELEQLKRDIQSLEQMQVEETKTTDRIQSDLLKCQKSLIASERMATLGGLIAGFTHEVNTPIGVSLTTISFLNKQYKTMQLAFDNQTLSKNDLDLFFGELSEAIDLTHKNLQRAVDYISSFKQNAVDQSNFNKRDFNIKTVIEDCIASVKPLVKRKDYHIDFECPDQINMYTYPGAVSHIVSNLVLNAVNHGFDGVDQGTIKVAVTTHGDQIKMCVSDDGKGIPDYAIKKIYTPFYTTKPTEGGTGLGLSIVHDLVTDSLDGTIECESHEGDGTSFTIEFPWTREDD